MALTEYNTWYDFSDPNPEPKPPYHTENTSCDVISKKLDDAILWIAMIHTKGDEKYAKRLISEISEKPHIIALETLSLPEVYKTYLSTQSTLISDLNGLYDHAKGEDTRELAETALFTLDKCDEMFKKAVKLTDAV